MNLRLRAFLHSVPYVLLFAVVLPWLFARWLGFGAITAPGVILGGALMLAGFCLSGWCVRSDPSAPRAGWTKSVSGGSNHG